MNLQIHTFLIMSSSCERSKTVDNVNVLVRLVNDLRACFSQTGPGPQGPQGGAAASGEINSRAFY